MILRKFFVAARLTGVVTGFLASTTLMTSTTQAQFIDNAQNLPIQGNFDPMAGPSVLGGDPNQNPNFGAPQQQMRPTSHTSGNMQSGHMNSNQMVSNSMRSSTSAADRAAFAQVYDLLAEVYFQREQTNMLYDTYVPQQPQNFVQNNQPTVPQNQFPPNNVVANNPVGGFEPNPPSQQAAVNGGFQNNAQQFPVNPVNQPIPNQNGGLDAQLGFEDDFASLPDFDAEPEQSSGGFFSNIYLGAYGAGTLAKKSSTDFAGFLTYDNEPKPSYGGGGLLGYKLGPIRAELEGMYSQSVRETANSSDVGIQPDGEEESVTTIAGLANAYYKFDLGSFGLFGGGSVGYAQYARKFGLAESSGKGLTYGPLAGLTYKIGSNLELAAQYRYLLAPEVEMTDDTINISETLDLSQHQAMLAVRFNF